MTSVYWKHTPTGGSPQSIDATLVIVLGLVTPRTYRVTLHWDRSYAYQSRGEIAVFTGGEFKTVLHLFHHDLSQFAAYDEWQSPKRGEFDRAGKLPALLRQQADELAALGSRIVSGG